MGGYERAWAWKSCMFAAAIALVLCATLAGLQTAYAASDGSSADGLKVGTMETVKTKAAYGDDAINTTGKANVHTVYRYGWVAGGNNTAIKRTQRNLDVTGDGWADKIRVIGTKSSTSGLLKRVRVWVNGKRIVAYTNTSNKINRVVVSVVTLANKQPYLWVNVLDGKGYGFQRLYQYDEDGFYTAISNKDVAKSRTSNQLISELYPDGNTVTVKYTLATTVTGLTRLRYTYRYEDGWLYRKSDTATDFSYATNKNGVYTQNALTAAGTFTVYKDKSLSAKKFSVAAGKTVHIKAVCLQGSKLLYKVKSGSKTGWISCPKIKRTSDKAPYTLFHETYGMVKLKSSIPTYSSTKYYDPRKLQRYNDHSLYIARNEICARNGVAFTNGELRSRFMKKSWYPSHRLSLNAVEQANLDLILSLEKNRGSLYAQL